MALMTLGTVAQYINGRAFKPEEWEENGKPIIRIQNLTNSSDVCNRTTNIYEEKYLVTDGDLLFAWSASLGAHIWHGEDGWLNQHIFKVVPNECVEKMYLYYYLLYVVDQLYAKTHGSGMVHITMKPFKDTPINVPILKEQQRIVDRIESLFAKLDEAKEKAQAVVDGFEDRKAAILHKAFTGELTNCKEELRTVHITDIIRHDKNALKAGPFGSALRKDMYVGSGYKIYGQEQVINGDERIGDYYIDEEKYQELIACKITPGDVLISLVGTVGKVLVLSEDCKPGIINPRLIKVSLDESKMLPLFFKYYFESGYLKNLYKSESHGTTMDVLNMGIMKRLPFPLVKIETQKEIIEILNNILEKEEQAKKVAEQVIDQIDAIKKSILSRAFSGELGTNDPADESAEELLKRIL